METQLKVGQKVVCLCMCGTSNVAFLIPSGDLIARNYETGEYCTYPSHWTLATPPTWINQNTGGTANLRSTPKEVEPITWETLGEGMELSLYGDHLLVEGRIGNIILLSKGGDSIRKSVIPYHVDELKNTGFTIVQPRRR